MKAIVTVSFLLAVVGCTSGGSGRSKTSSSAKADTTSAAACVAPGSSRWAGVLEGTFSTTCDSGKSYQGTWRMVIDGDGHGRGTATGASMPDETLDGDITSGGELVGMSVHGCPWSGALAATGDTASGQTTCDSGCTTSWTGSYTSHTPTCELPPDDVGGSVDDTTSGGDPGSPPDTSGGGPVGPADAGGGFDTAVSPTAPENTNSACADGKDNDGDGYTDCVDFDCSKNTAITVCAPIEPDACNPFTLHGCKSEGAGATCDQAKAKGGSFQCFAPPNDATACGTCDNTNGPFCGPGKKCLNGKCAYFCCSGEPIESGICDTTGFEAWGIGLAVTAVGSGVAVCGGDTVPANRTCFKQRAPDAQPRPLYSACIANNECASGECLLGTCSLVCGGQAGSDVSLCPAPPASLATGVTPACEYNTDVPCCRVQNICMLACGAGSVCPAGKQCQEGICR